VATDTCNKINNDKWRGQRAIGVVYNPQYEKYKNYVSPILPLGYGAFYLLKPMHYFLYMPTKDDKDFPETLSTGVLLNPG
jgi:erythromycin esterase